MNLVWDKDSFSVFLARKVKANALSNQKRVFDLLVAYFPHLGLPILAEQWQGPYWIYYFLKIRCSSKCVSNVAVTNRWGKSCFHSAYRQVKIARPYQHSSGKGSPLQKLQKICTRWKTRIWFQKKCEVIILDWWNVSKAFPHKIKKAAKTVPKQLFKTYSKRPETWILMFYILSF